LASTSAQQALRSGTSAGANYCEACGAESRADFVHKMQLVVKELRETLFWIEVSRKAKLLVPERVDGLVKETNELVAIGVKSVLTAKKNAEMPK
jgi:four helix bundle protein